MNEINRFILARDKFVSKMHLKQCGFTYIAADHLLKTEKEFKNLKKQEIQNIFIKMNWIKLVFNMTWLMEILKIYLEEQLLIKHYIIKHLLLLKIQNLIDIKEV